ncbi:hypothetical protein [Orbus mooreae]|uniref:hypothetical protein n=1 Tax=Orbus mooreae TaxID=3074107 RepID=UPI00370DE149
MNDNKYWFISRKEWTEIIREIDSPNPFRYQTFSISVRKAKQLQQVSYFDEDDYQSIIDYCLTYSDSCHGLSQVFDLLANQYGAGHYLKSLSEQRKVLIDGLKNQHIVLLRETVTHSDYEPVQPTVIPEKMNYLTDEQFLVSHMEDPTNWIEFEVTGVANEPFTLFNSKTGEIVTQGQLDALGHAYVEIPEETVFLVDVAFSKTKEYRSWYYTLLDYHSQMFAGSVDAMASSLDAINDFHLAEVVPIAKLYQVLGLSKYFSPNSSGGSKLMPAKTQGGELIRSASAFITGFYLLDLAGFSYIKPVSTFGQYSRGVAAFGVVNATVTPVMEHRIADLLSKDAGLKSVVLDYLSVHPDDSNAEARFKNGLEGLALGSVLEPLFIVFRIIKNSLTRTLITRIPTRRTYKLEAEKVEIEPIKQTESTNEIDIGKESTNITKTGNTLPDIAQLSLAANSVNRNGLTDAGRALQKHGGREGSVYIYTNQKPSILNKEAQDIVNDILSNPQSKIEYKKATENKKIIDVIDVTAPDGRKLRFNESGTRLIGFREPPKNR